MSTETTGKNEIYVGTAGWTIPSQCKAAFPEAGTHLTRYAQVLTAVEINSSFYREHKFATYQKWATSTPAEFRFSVKLSRHFTQVMRLRETGSRLEDVLSGIAGLGHKWAILVIQLPPSLDFVFQDTKNFIEGLRRNYLGEVVWEPRHQSWASSRAIDLLASHQMSKVMADPERCRLAKTERLKVERVRYLRLHGTPEIYKSRYEPERIARITKSLLTPPLETSEASWCIFDNTTFGYATENALDVMAAYRKY